MAFAERHGKRLLRAPKLRQEEITAVAKKLFRKSLLAPSGCYTVRLIISETGGLN
jgi:hypothetical protein